MRDCTHVKDGIGGEVYIVKHMCYLPFSIWISKIFLKSAD
jgi:hypothetical protein